MNEKKTKAIKRVLLTIAIEALKVLLFVLPTRGRPIRGDFPGGEEMYSSQVTLDGGGGGNDCLLSIYIQTSLMFYDSSFIQKC